MKKPRELEAWGRAKARERYAGGGGVEGDDYAVNSFFDSLTKSRTPGENRYIERTRKYPFRMGLGPSASEEHLSKQRLIDMMDAKRISDSVPRRKD